MTTVPIYSGGMPEFGPNSFDWGMIGGAPRMDQPGGGMGGLMQNQQGFGFNIPTLQLGFGALNSLGGLYAGLENLNLAKKQFRFTKDYANQNLTNQISSYNTALEDRARSRAAVEGQSQAESDAYIEKNRLRKTI